MFAVHARSSRRRSQKGFQDGVTLIEMLVTLAVAAILLAAAVPSFTALVQNNRAAAQVNDLVGAMHTARGEAIKRGFPVTLCASSNQTSCSGGASWSGGWIVFQDGAATGNPQTPQAADDPRWVRVWYPLEGRSSLTGGVSYLRFHPNGTASWSGGSGATRNFVLDIPNCSGQQKKEVAINRLGHVTTRSLPCAG